jgi:hypothetical protein
MVYKHKLPGDPAVIAMGYTSFIIIFFLAQFTFFLFVAFALGVAGISKSADDLTLYEAHPETFSDRSKRNISDGRNISGFSMLAAAVLLIHKGIMYLIN